MSGSFNLIRIGGSGVLENVQTAQGGGAGDTQITLTPSAKTGPITVTASAALFTADDVGRLIAIKDEAPNRGVATAYGVGAIFYADDRGVRRVYRVIKAGTTAAANLAGTTPDYDLNTPTGETLDLRDGTCILRYLGRGKSAWGWGKITAYASSTSVTMQVADDGTLANTTASLHWRLGEFGGSRGWPRAGCFFQNRLVVAGTAARPQSVWASETGDFERFSPCEPDGVVLDTNAVSQAVDDDQLSEILFTSPNAKGVVLGTSSGPFLFGPSSNTNRVLTPSNAEARRQGDQGATTSCAALRIGGTTIYVDETGRALFELAYDFASDSYASGDLTLLSQHIAGSGFVEVAYQRNPDGVIWAVREDGVLCSLTYDKDQEVRAWGRHILGGTDVVVESVCCVPAADGKSDDVYVSVRRTVNGVEQRWVEVIGAPFRGDIQAQSDAFYVDAGLTYRGAPATTITGLSHLEGLTVRVVADGAVRTDRTVTSGAINIGTPAASVVHVGLRFTSRVRTLPLEGGGGKGTAMGQKRRVTKVAARLMETAAFRISMNGGERELVDFRTPDDAMDTAVPLFTGVKRWPAPGGWDDDFSQTFESYHGLPFCLLGVAMDVTVNDG